MTIHLEEPADLLDLVGSPLGTTKWMKLSQQQVDLFAESTGDHQWIHTDPQRAARGPFKGAVAHSFLTLSLTPMFTSEVLQIRELTMAFTYGLGKVNFCVAVPVGSLGSPAGLVDTVKLLMATIGAEVMPCSAACRVIDSISSALRTSKTYTSAPLVLWVCSSTRSPQVWKRTNSTLVDMSPQWLAL